MKKEIENEILEGYRSIAFGDVSDPVRLLFCEDAPPQLLKSMNLSSIAEIKRQKGGMEIKFYDRLKALEGMQNMSVGQDETCGFMQALERGSAALRGEIT